MNTQHLTARLRRAIKDSFPNLVDFSQSVANPATPVAMPTPVVTRELVGDGSDFHLFSLLFEEGFPHTHAVMADNTELVFPVTVGIQPFINTRSSDTIETLSTS